LESELATQNTAPTASIASPHFHSLSNLVASTTLSSPSFGDQQQTPQQHSQQHSPVFAGLSQADSFSARSIPHHNRHGKEPFFAANMLVGDSGLRANAENGVQDNEELMTEETTFDSDVSESASTEDNEDVSDDEESDDSEGSGGALVIDGRLFMADVSWVQWFCALTGHEFFCEVDEEFIDDDFNLTGLNEIVPNFNEALDVIQDIALGLISL
jgi:hypothetical protein